MEEFMNNEMDVINVDADLSEVEGNSGMSTGVAMLVGAGLTLAITAGVKLAKKLWNDHKAKKEAEDVALRDVVDAADESEE